MNVISVTKFKKRSDKLAENVLLCSRSFLQPRGRTAQAQLSVLTSVSLSVGNTEHLQVQMLLRYKEENPKILLKCPKTTGSRMKGVSSMETLPNPDLTHTDQGSDTELQLQAHAVPAQQ